MKIYFDSSALVKLYTAEDGAEIVVKHLEKLKPPLVIYRLHELEIQNAMRLKAFRKEWSRNHLRDALSSFRSDIANGLFRIEQIDWDKIFFSASTLSAELSSRLGLRSLDILHLAIAKQIGSKIFVSFDERQLSAARALKMSI